MKINASQLQPKLLTNSLVKYFELISNYKLQCIIVDNSYELKIIGYDPYLFQPKV